MLMPVLCDNYGGACPIYWVNHVNRAILLNNAVGRVGDVAIFR